MYRGAHWYVYPPHFVDSVPSGGSTIELGGGAAAPPHRYKMPPLLLNCRPPSHYDIHINTTRVTVFPYSGDVIHSQLSGIVSTTVKIVIVNCPIFIMNYQILNDN